FLTGEMGKFFQLALTDTEFPVSTLNAPGLSLREVCACDTRPRDCWTCARAIRFSCRVTLSSARTRMDDLVFGVRCLSTKPPGSSSDVRWRVTGFNARLPSPRADAKTTTH